MKTPGDIMDSADSASRRWGAPRLADLLRGAVQNPRKRSPEELAQLEREWQEREAKEKADHEAAQEQAWPTHLQLVGAPREARDALTAPTVLDTPALLAAREVLVTGLRTLLLSGHTGVGKTAGACHLFRAAVRYETRTGQRLPEWDASSGVFIRWTALKRLSDYESEDKLLYRKACTARVLVLDDLGGLPGETVGPRHRELLEELVDRRDRPGLVTAYTTNLSLRRHEGEECSAFSAFVGPRVVSRMCRQGTFLLRDCGTRDLRKGTAP